MMLDHFSVGQLVVVVVVVVVDGQVVSQRGSRHSRRAYPHGRLLVVIWLLNETRQPNDSSVNRYETNDGLRPIRSSSRSYIISSPSSFYGRLTPRQLWLFGKTLVRWKSESRKIKATVKLLSRRRRSYKRFFCLVGGVILSRSFGSDFMGSFPHTQDATEKEIERERERGIRKEKGTGQVDRSSVYRHKQ